MLPQRRYGELDGSVSLFRPSPDNEVSARCRRVRWVGVGYRRDEHCPSNPLEKKDSDVAQ